VSGVRDRFEASSAGDLAPLRRLIFRRQMKRRALAVHAPVVTGGVRVSSSAPNSQPATTSLTQWKPTSTLATPTAVDTAIQPASSTRR